MKPSDPESSPPLAAGQPREDSELSNNSRRAVSCPAGSIAHLSAISTIPKESRESGCLLRWRAPHPPNRFKTIDRTGRSKGCRDSPGNDGRARGEIRAPITDRDPAAHRQCEWGNSCVAVDGSRPDQFDFLSRAGPHERAADIREAGRSVLASRQARADRHSPGARKFPGAGAIGGFGTARRRLVTLPR
jgi:hypothetical protein